MQVADHGRGTEVPARQVERVLRRDVQARQPQPGLVLAPLGDRVGEQVEMRQRQVEPQPQEREAPLLFGGMRAGASSLQSPDVAEELTPQPPPPADQVTLDAHLRRG